MSLSAIGAEIEGGALRAPPPPFPQSNKMWKGARSLRVFIIQVCKEIINVKNMD